MPSDKSESSESLADVWAKRYDDRDEDLASELWALRLAKREEAMARPFGNFKMPDEPGSDLRHAANDSGDKPSAA
jgi:hypothetical protein